MGPTEEGRARTTLRYPYALVCSAAVVMLLYKAVTIARLAPLNVLLGWLLELAALVALAASWAASQRVRALRVPGSVLFYLLAHLLLIPSLSHTYFFESAADRHFSLLEIDLRTLGFFFSNVLPIRGALLMAGLLVAMHVGAYLLTRRRLREPSLSIAGVVAAVLCAVLLRVSPPLPTPLADISADLAERWFTPQLTIDRSKPAAHAPRDLDRSAIVPHGAARYDKILVFVMETMTSATFAVESEALADSTFVHAARPHAQRFERYFATNQDSRTGMLSMLGSRFIPYEAYTEEGRDHYKFLGQRSSLVDALKREGYRAAFAVSQREIELVVGDLAWDELLHFEGDDTTKLAQDHLCFVPYEFEHSCEDRALLPRVLDFLDRTPRAFLYQEFIWGHAIEYNHASGRTNSDYYSSYLDAIVAHLAKTGALDKTLIVLTSDHGFREKPAQREREVYQIPLWFFSPAFTSSEDTALRSHLDFKDLLFHYAFEGVALPAPDPFVMVVGPTGTSFVTLLTEPGQLLLMKARDNSRLLMHSEGYPERELAKTRAADALRLFEDYLDYFGRL